MRLPRSKLNEAQTERLLEHFAAGTAARPAAALVGVNRNSARLFYHRLRELIALRVAQKAVGLCPQDAGEPGAVPLFALYKQHGRVRAALLKDAGSAAGGPQPDAIVYARAPHARRVLRAADLRFRRRAAAGRGIDSIENFWSQAQRRLRRYNGIPRANFHLFLAECEWRACHGSAARQLQILRQWLKRGECARPMPSPAAKIHSRPHGATAGRRHTS